jgi:hypothetical protein
LHVIGVEDNLTEMHIGHQDLGLKSGIPKIVALIDDTSINVEFDGIERGAPSANDP